MLSACLMPGRQGSDSADDARANNIASRKPVEQGSHISCQLMPWVPPQKGLSPMAVNPRRSAQEAAGGIMSQVHQNTNVAYAGRRVRGCKHAQCSSQTHRPTCCHRSCSRLANPWPS